MRQRFLTTRNICLGLVLIISSLLVITSFLYGEIEELGYDFYDSFVLIGLMVLLSIIAVKTSLRITNIRARIYLLTLFAFLMIWNFLTILSKGTNETMSRYFIYFSFFPILIIPLIWLNFILYLFVNNNKVKKYTKIISCLGTIIFLFFILSNDLHSFVMVFNGHEYTKRILYYIICGYVYIEITYATTVLFIAIRKKVQFYQLIVPIFLILTIIVYTTICLNQEIHTRYLEDQSIVYSILGSVCIFLFFNLGIASNSGDYNHIFEKATYPIAIYNNYGEIGFQNNSYQKMKLGDNWKINEHKLQNGRIFMLTDISQINVLKKEMLDEIKSIEVHIEQMKKEDLTNDDYDYFLNDLEEELQKQNKTLQKLTSRLPKVINEENIKKTEKTLNEIKDFLIHLQRKSEIIILCQKNEVIDINKFKECLQYFIDDLSNKADIEFEINKYSELSMCDAHKICDSFQKIIHKLNIDKQTKIKLYFFVDKDISYNIYLNDYIVDKMSLNKFTIENTNIEVFIEKNNTRIDVQMERGDHQ